MSIPMSDSQTFLPNGKPISVLYHWLIPSLIVVLIFVKFGLDFNNIIAAIILFWIYSLDILLYKKAISITISTKENLLLYNYRNCWGQIRLVEVDLSNVTVSFKYRLVNLNYRIFSKLRFRWRILLYNGSYFHNRAVIKEDDELGYTKDQLDQMITLIKQNCLSSGEAV
jgi:hypothetical protein